MSHETLQRKAKRSLFGLLTNDHSLRHAVIWGKLSYGSQCKLGSRFVETMLSVIEFCRQQNQIVIDFVTKSIRTQFNRISMPELLFGA